MAQSVAGVFSVLCLMARSAYAAPSPSIELDPCIASEIDSDEVRRLTTLELRDWPATTATAEIRVTCADDHQEIQLRKHSGDPAISRSIDLTAKPGTDREAKARELALGIAELLRSATAEPPVSAPPPPAPTTPPPRIEPAVVAAPRVPPWQLGFGLSATIEHWTGGETLLGLDMDGRAHFGRFLVLEMYLGGRKSREHAITNGTVDAHGIAAGLGVGVEAMRDHRHAGLSFSARLGGQWLRYAAVGPDGVTYGGGDGGVLSAAGAGTAWFAIAAPLCVTADLAAGGALHGVAVQNGSAQISRVGGALLSARVGLAAVF